MYNSTIETLHAALKADTLEVILSKGNIIHLKGDYSIEIESENLFKLKQDGLVIAPFNDIKEMCQFIKMDIKLNEEN